MKRSYVIMGKERERAGKIGGESMERRRKKK